MPNIVIDTAWINKLLASDNPAEVGIQLFLSGGWVIFVFVIFYGLWYIWIEARQTQWGAKVKKVLLAIDVPKDTEQSPLAVEQVFATIAGSLSVFDRIEKYWIGKFQPTFSFEIVSTGGYIQFYVRTWTKFRDVVEAAIYAQYPDAQIAEVEDYVNNIPKRFPAPGWDLFGMEFKLYNGDHYPIRTYPEFEDGLSGELKDPIASLLEGLSKFRPGENLWLQIMVQPMISNDWIKEGEKLVNKLIGKKGSGGAPTFKSEITGLPASMISAAMMADAQLKEKKDEPPSMMLHLSPGEKSGVEAIQKKHSKESFKVKIRFAYACKEEVFAKARTVALIKGALSQFTILGCNGFRPYVGVTTKSDYVWQRKKIFEYLTLFMVRTLETRQNILLTSYRDRDMSIGAPASVMNIEELASVYHFPVIGVKAPLVKKTLSKRTEPPVSLPVSEGGVYEKMPASVAFPMATKSVTTKAPAPFDIPESPRPQRSSSVDMEKDMVPPNLPFV